MPKKFAGENSKAVAARARKTAAKEEENLRKEKEKEEEFWKDDDKLINRKQQRKELQEKKKQESLQKKIEIKSLLLEEENDFKQTGKQPRTKVTRAQIQEQEERKATVNNSTKKKDMVTHLEQPLSENINRLDVEGLEARSVTEAIAILSTKDTQEDLHPEKRMKAAYASFESANLPRIKQENPTLRLSQLKQILNKEWLKSPENPLNQRVLAK